MSKEQQIYNYLCDMSGTDLKVMNKIVNGGENCGE